MLLTPTARPPLAATAAGPLRVRSDGGLTQLRRLAMGLALAFTVTAVGLLVGAGPTYAWDGGSFSSSSEHELVSLTNRARANAGLKALKIDSTLTSIARWRSKDMIVRDYFSHDIPGGKQVFAVLDSHGFCYSVAGENIGWTDDKDSTATSTIQGMFMGSPGHRANILGKRWDVIGIGAYKDSKTQKKMWTVLFADKCGSTAPKQTPKPTVKPHPTPKATVKPRSTPKPTPAPTPVASAAPSASLAPSPVALPEPTGIGTTGRDESTAATAASLPPAGQAGGTPAADNSTSMRVVDEPAPPGLIETVVGDVTGLFLGD